MKKKTFLISSMTEGDLIKRQTETQIKLLKDELVALRKLQDQDEVQRLPARDNKR